MSQMTQSLFILQTNSGLTESLAYSSFAQCAKTKVFSRYPNAGTFTEAYSFHSNQDETSVYEVTCTQRSKLTGDEQSW